MLALEGDVLHVQPKHVLLVVGSWVASAAAVAGVPAAIASGGSAVALNCAAAAVGTWLFSDFFSGVVHWGADNYGSGKTPIFGGVIAAFQGHHDLPFTITHRPFFNNVHKIALAVLALMPLALLISSAPAWRVGAVVFFNAQMLSQELHKCSHMTEPPGWIAWMQDHGLVLSRKEHGRHHRSPYGAHYCILTGSCNRFLDSIDFWRRLEAMVYRFNHAEPRCWILDPELKAQSLARY